MLSANSSLQPAEIDRRSVGEAAADAFSGGVDHQTKLASHPLGVVAQLVEQEGPQPVSIVEGLRSDLVDEPGDSGGDEPFGVSAFLGGEVMVGPPWWSRPRGSYLMRVGRVPHR